MTGLRAPPLFFLSLATASLPVSVVLIGFIFAAADRFAGHVAWIVMERPGLLFTRSLLVRIFVVAHKRSFLYENGVERSPFLRTQKIIREEPGRSIGLRRAGGRAKCLLPCPHANEGAADRRAAK
jgi:hypothetical protein